MVFFISLDFIDVINIFIHTLLNVFAHIHSDHSEVHVLSSALMHFSGTALDSRIAGL